MGDTACLNTTIISLRPRFVLFDSDWEDSSLLPSTLGGLELSSFVDDMFSPVAPAAAIFDSTYIGTVSTS